MNTANTAQISVRAARSTLLLPILVGGAIAGTFDLIAALWTFGPNGMRAVAAGMLGRTAFQGGLVTLVIGILLHYFIAFSIAATNNTAAVLAARRTYHEPRSNLTLMDDSGVRVWATAISMNARNGRKIIYRYAQELNPAFDQGSQPFRIIIVWRYVSDSGQPHTEDHDAMNRLEDALEPVLYPDLFATLALVSTGENLREWTYYAKSEDEFMDRLKDALAGMQHFPIEIHTALDPTWAVYEQFRVGVKQ
jgi:hypothetical protein